MDKLAGVKAESLREALSNARTAKAAKRLMIALAYKEGIPVDVLTERYGIARSTVYYWLDRFENQSIDEAIEDEERPGRPSALTETQRKALRRTLNGNPAEYGYEEVEWTPATVRQYIERDFDVSYSLGHVRYLLRNDIDRAD